MGVADNEPAVAATIDGLDCCCILGIIGGIEIRGNGCLRFVFTGVLVPEFSGREIFCGAVLGAILGRLTD